MVIHKKYSKLNKCTFVCAHEAIFVHKHLNTLYIRDENMMQFIVCHSNIIFMMLCAIQ